MAEWYDNPDNTFNFFRWSSGDGRLLSDIQQPELYCVGIASNAAPNTLYETEVFENQNNFFRWIDGNGRTLAEITQYFCDQRNGKAYSDGYSDGYS